MCSASTSTLLDARNAIDAVPPGLRTALGPRSSCRVSSVWRFSDLRACLRLWQFQTQLQISKSPPQFHLLLQCSTSLTLLLLIIFCYPHPPNRAVVLVSHSIHMSIAYLYCTLVLISFCLVPFSSAHESSVIFQYLPTFSGSRFLHLPFSEKQSSLGDDSWPPTPRFHPNPLLHYFLIHEPRRSAPSLNSLLRWSILDPTKKKVL